MKGMGVMVQSMEYLLETLPWFITLGLFFLIVLVAVIVARPFLPRNSFDPKDCW
jgi:hypothetical protein